MNQPQADSPARAAILASEPQLFTSDLEAAFAFYVGKLGFAVVFVYGELPFYAQVARDSGRLNLRWIHAGPVFDAAFLAWEEDVLAATLVVDDAIRTAI